MIRQLTTAVSLGTVLLLTSSIAHAQFGGLSVQIGGYGYGNNNYQNLGYGNNFYRGYGYNNPSYQSYYPSYGYANNGYYNNNLNGGYSYSSPNYYVVPQRVLPVRRFRRW